MATTITVTMSPTEWRAFLAVTVSASASHVEIQRTADGAVTVDWVRGTEPTNVHLSSMSGATSRTVYDSEFPLDTPVQYRARGVNPATAFVDTWSAWSAAQQLPSQGCQYVIHGVARPGRFWAGDFSDEPGFQQDAPRGVFYRLGIADPTVVLGQRRASTSAGLTILAKTHAERALVESVVGQDDVMCVRGAASQGWVTQYVTVGAISFAHRRPVTVGAWLIKCPWVEVAKPDSTPIVSFGTTWQQVIDTYLTWSQVMGANATWNALATRVL